MHYSPLSGRQNLLCIHLLLLYRDSKVVIVSKQVEGTLVFAFDVVVVAEQAVNWMNFLLKMMNTDSVT